MKFESVAASRLLRGLLTASPPCDFLCSTESARSEEEIVAELTDIAYRALLQQGLKRSFVDVELERWTEIRRAVSGVVRFVECDRRAVTLVTS